MNASSPGIVMFNKKINKINKTVFLDQSCLNNEMSTFIKNSQKTQTL